MRCKGKRTLLNMHVRLCLRHQMANGRGQAVSLSICYLAMIALAIAMNLMPVYLLLLGQGVGDETPLDKEGSGCWLSDKDDLRGDG